MNIVLFDKALTSSDWLNFLGNIAGAMLGVVGAFCVMLWQLKREREKNSKEKIDNTFFNLLTLFQNVKDELDTDKFIKYIKHELISHRHDEREKYFTDRFSEKKEQFIQDIKSFNEQTNEKYNEICNVILEMIEKGKDESYYLELHYYSQSIAHEDIKIFNEKFKDIIEFSSINRNRDSEFPYELNEIDIEEMLIVFYNCIYYEKGEKFKELLEKTEKGKRLDFFGDKKDLENLKNGYDLPFFSKEKLLFPEYDMRYLEELINGTPTKAN